MKAQARSVRDLPEKPDCLVLYETVKLHHLPLVAGGLMEQPHLWLLEYEVVNQTVKTFEAIEEANRKLLEKQAQGQT